VPSGDRDVQVLVVADDHLTRAGLASLLADQPGCSVVGQVSAAELAVTSVSVFDPDVVIWDLGWQTDQSFEVSIGDASGGYPVIVLVPDVGLADDRWPTNVRGVLQRDATESAVVAAAAAVMQGLVVHDADLAHTTPDTPPDGGDAAPATSLTAREVEVLALIAEGLANKGIAARLNISEHTVKFHVNAIFGKLGAQSRTEAVTLATRLGMITL